MRLAFSLFGHELWAITFSRDELLELEFVDCTGAEIEDAEPLRLGFHGPKPPPADDRH